MLFLLSAHVVRIGEPLIPGSIQSRVTITLQSSVLLTSHFIQRIPQILGNVKLVERNLVLRIRH